MTGGLSDRARVPLILIRLIPLARLRTVAEKFYPPGTKVRDKKIGYIIKLNSMMNPIPQRLNIYDKELNAFCLFVRERLGSKTFTSLFNRALAEDFLLYSHREGLMFTGREELRREMLRREINAWSRAPRHG